MNAGQFILFAYEFWEPRGGWKDYHGSFGTLGEAKGAGNAIIQEKGGYPPRYHYHIADILLGEIVYTPSRPPE